MSRDVKLTHFFGLNTIDEVDHLLINAHDWGEQFFLDYFKNFFERDNVTSDKVTLVTNGSTTLLMIASNAERISQQIMKTEFGWGGADLLLAAAKVARRLA